MPIGRTQVQQDVLDALISEDILPIAWPEWTQEELDEYELYFRPNYVQIEETYEREEEEDDDSVDFWGYVSHWWNS